jgi:hypothetical protein
MNNDPKLHSNRGMLFNATNILQWPDVKSVNNIIHKNVQYILPTMNTVATIVMTDPLTFAGTISVITI